MVVSGSSNFAFASCAKLKTCSVYCSQLKARSCVSATFFFMSVIWVVSSSLRAVYCSSLIRSRIRIVENKGSGDLDLSGLWDFKLEDANGVQKGQSIGGIGIKKLPTGSLSPNGKASGDVLFEADKNALTNLKLRYKPLFSFADEVVIELQ